MGFDVFLLRFAEGRSAEVDRRAVLQVLRAATYRGPNESGFYVVAFPDGVEAVLWAEGLESEGPFDGCAFHIRAFGDGLMEFLFDVARAGDMVLFPAMGGNSLVLVSEGQKAAVPADMQEDFQTVVVRSGGELGAVLRGGFEGWSAYRDQVVRQSEGATGA